MNFENRISLAIIVGSLFIAGAIFGGFYFTKLEVGLKASVTESVVKEEGKTGIFDKYAKVNDFEEISDGDHVFGNPDAKISLIEYSDFECPFCKRFHGIAEQVVKAYDGDVNWIYRHFPLDFHDPLATKEAEASECAADLGGSDVFWEYAEKIFERTSSNGKGLELDELTEIAGELGLDKKDFDACLESGKFSEKVRQSIIDGGRAGITGTPGNIVVNNETGEGFEVMGAQPFSEFKLLIDEML